MNTRKIVNTKNYAERMHGSVADKLFWVGDILPALKYEASQAT